MADSTIAYLTPEAKARVEIDKMLAAAGWSVQDARDVNLAASSGVAVREFILEPPHGRADYLLFVDREAVGVIEAKPEGATLTGVEWQSAKYLDGLPEWVTSALEGALPFAYQSTGVETRFTNTLDPDARSRQVFWFHRPETLAAWIREVHESPAGPTLRHRLTKMPPAYLADLWPPKDLAVRNLERSLAANRPRALIQMATGSGKTLLAAFVSRGASEARKSRPRARRASPCAAAYDLPDVRRRATLARPAILQRLPQARAHGRVPGGRAGRARPAGNGGARPEPRRAGRSQARAAGVRTGAYDPPVGRPAS